MRILLVSNHTYPASGIHSAGRRPRTLPSGSGQHIHDLLARGLAALGHEVFYLLQPGVAEPLPANITAVSDSLPYVDIIHGIAGMAGSAPGSLSADLLQGVPWVVTCHRGKNVQRSRDPVASWRWIFVSQTQAAAYGSNRFVPNGIDPAEYCYAEKKEAYFLFMAGMNYYREKGLHTALQLSQKMQFDLVVAGTSNETQRIQEVSALCGKYQAHYVGDVRGGEKAKLLAAAKALIFPTQQPEGCPLVIAESLMSGTPVIASSEAACSEMVCSEVGFICRTEQDYMDAVQDIGKIPSSVCREYAIEKYHYLRMAEDYVKEYQKEMNV